MQIWGKRVSGRGHSMSKGPGAGLDLMCWRNSEEARVWSRVSEGERGRRGGQGGDGAGRTGPCEMEEGALESCMQSWEGT